MSSNMNQTVNDESGRNENSADIPRGGKHVRDTSRMTVLVPGYGGDSANVA